MEHEFDSRIHYIKFRTRRLQDFFAVAFFINGKDNALIVYGLYY